MAIKYPYIPTGRVHRYVEADNQFMQHAKSFARTRSLDKSMPNSSIIVRSDGMILGQAANGSDHHEKHGCERVKLKMPTGQGYDLCEGCHPKNHSEPKAIAEAQRIGADVHGADLYLWGHWWCCQPCWDAMIAAGIRDVYLLKGSEILFNREHKDNIIGKQFA